MNQPPVNKQANQVSNQVNCFITNVNKQYHYINAMFLHEYNCLDTQAPFNMSEKDLEFAKKQKKQVVQHIESLIEGMIRENPAKFIKSPISLDKKNITLKYTKYCKIFNKSGHPISVESLKGNKADIIFKLLPYTIKGKSGEEILGVSAITSQITIL